MNKFLKDSEDRLTSLKRNTESKRGDAEQEEVNLLLLSIYLSQQSTCCLAGAFFNTNSTFL